MNNRARMGHRHLIFNEDHENTGLRTIFGYGGIGAMNHIAAEGLTYG